MLPVIFSSWSGYEFILGVSFSKITLYGKQSNKIQAKYESEGRMLWKQQTQSEFKAESACGL